MNGINKFMGIGNLTRDAELKQTNNGKAVSNFGIAINEGKDKVTFLDVSLWGKSATAVSEWLTKGKQVFIEGSLEIQSWEKEGVKKSKAVINCFNIQLLGGIDKQDQKQIVQDSKPASFEPNLSDVPF